VIGNQSKNAGFLLFSRAVLSQPELLPAQRASSPLEALSRQATHRDRGAQFEAAPGQALWISRLRDAVLIAADYTLLLPLVAAGLLVEALMQNHAFLVWLVSAECALQLAVLAALIVINYTVNVENESLRLDAVARSRGDAESR
jgi:hypothetical protein